MACFVKAGDEYINLDLILKVEAPLGEGYLRVYFQGKEAPEMYKKDQDRTNALRQKIDEQIRKQGC
jgi:hypothetical protein